MKNNMLSPIVNSFIFYWNDKMIDILLRWIHNDSSMAIFFFNVNYHKWEQMIRIKTFKRLKNNNCKKTFKYLILFSKISHVKVSCNICIVNKIAIMNEKKNMIVQSRKTKIEKNYFSNKKILTIF